MAKNFARGVGKNHFQGDARLHESSERDESLVSHVRNLLLERSRDRVRSNGAAALVDNTGGTAPVQYLNQDSGVFTGTDLEGLTDGALATGVNSIADTVTDAYAVLMERLNDSVFALLGMGTADEGPGTIAASGTVAVIDETVANNTGDTDACDLDSMNAIRNDLLHMELTVIQAIDDARVAVGLSRSMPDKPGRVVIGAAETFVFAAGTTITRDVGSFVDDGFVEGDEIEIVGSELNNTTTGDITATVTITSMTAVELTCSVTFSAETVTNAEALAGFGLRTLKRNVPGRLAGAAPGPALDETVTTDFDSAGPNWEFAFETGTAAITNATVTTATSSGTIANAPLAADWDLFIVERNDNIARMIDMVDEIYQATAAADDPGVPTTTIGPAFFNATDLAAGTSQFVTSPVSGRIRAFRTMVVDAALDNSVVLTLEVDTVAVTGASITHGVDAIGIHSEDAVADTATNIVDKGQRIEITSDGDTTTGALLVWIDVVETNETEDALVGYVA